MSETCLFWTHYTSSSFEYSCKPYHTTDDTTYLGAISGWKDCPPEIQANVHYAILTAPKNDFPCPKNNSRFSSDVIHDIASWQDCG